MSKTTLIAITDICESHGIEQSYVTTLEDYGFVTIQSQQYIKNEELVRVEKIIRLNREMKINFEGIDVILNLLDKLDKASETERRLKKRLRIYEEL